MGPPAVRVVLVIVLCSATLPGTTMVHAGGSSLPDEETATPDISRVDNQCSPLQRRQDLLDNRMNERDTHFTERDTDLNTRLNGLNTRQNEVDARLNSRLNGMDARLNRIDSRFDDLETVMSDMKEYLRQRIDALEIKAEWALADTKHKEEKREVGTRDNQPNSTSQIPKDCQEAYTMGSTSSGVYRIAPEPNTHIDVFCEQELDGGGWTVFQLRKDGTINFYQDWSSYKEGFGELTGEFWLGNTNIHIITKQHDQQLNIELVSPEGEVKYANFAHFSIADEADKYRLNVTGYSGGRPPGDSLTHHSGSQFSTKDEDNDADPASCAKRYMGGWWYIHGCHYANLNGVYGGKDYKGLTWNHWKGPVSMRSTRMLLRKTP